MPDVRDKASRGPSKAGGEAPGALLSDDERDRLLDGLRPFGAVVLAVSGGPDSLAMMHLAARWRRALGDAGPHLSVATVDHGLRPGSCEEAAEVGRRAAALGLPHRTLTWSGPKPSSGRQAAARAARYALLLDHVVREVAPASPPPYAIAVAHTLDDQAETLLMRLGRGSGLDGLAGIPQQRPLAIDPPVTLLRPLLAVAKTRLVGTLTALGEDWIDDPSNLDQSYERVRLRAAAGALAAAGLTNDHLALSARRLARAHQALESATDTFEQAAVGLHDGAYATIALGDFEAAPEEIRVRTLQRQVTRFGAPNAPAQLGKLEAACARLALRVPTQMSLGGCLLARRRDAIAVFREPGRLGLPVLDLQPGAALIWDGRFRITASPALPAPLQVRALTSAALRALELPKVSPLPRQALTTLPAVWQGDRLLAVPAAAGLGEDVYRHPGITISFIDRVSHHALSTEDVMLP